MLEQLFKTIVLGTIQGLTEWLPISSTGHLEIARQFLLPETAEYFEAIVGILHIGTLIAVLVFYRQDIKNILTALARLDFKSEDGKLVPLIVVGTIPVVVIGLIFGSTIEEAFKTFLPLAIAFIICGFWLYASKAGKETTENFSHTRALLIGIAQAIAIVPGISRSGATIATALLLGIQREKAFRFSILLSIPAIVGAATLTGYREFPLIASSQLSWIDLLAGASVSALVGYFALKLLKKTVVNKRFYMFAFYCWLISLILLGLSLTAF